MEPAAALNIIKAMADGIHPITGEMFPHDSPYQNPEVIHALFAAADALKARIRYRERKESLPERAGLPWDEQEANLLIQYFKQGESLVQLAQRHQRTRGAITSKLVDLGIFETREQARNSIPK